MSTVMIACKHPSGVILNLDNMEIVGNSARVKKGASVTLRGWAHYTNHPDPSAGTGGYVLTEVPADFWEAWLASHPDFSMLEDRTIVGPHKDSMGQARAMSAIPKMFEMDPSEFKIVQAS